MELTEARVEELIEQVNNLEETWYDADKEAAASLRGALRPQRNHTGLIALVVLALVAASCGTDAEESTTTTSDSATISSPQTTTPETSTTAADEPGTTSEEPSTEISCDSPIDLQFAFITPEDSAYDAGGDAFGEYLESNAPGCFNFQSFPGGQLGQEQDIEQAIQAGAIQMGVGAFALASFVDEAPLFMTPFVFSGRDHTYEMTAGPVGEEFAQRVEDQAGFKVLGYFTAGDRNILSTVPIRSEEDLNGLTLRVAPSDLQVGIWREIGVNPVDLPFGDMYTGLQTGTVDAIELDPALIVALSLYEVTDYYTLTDHLTGAFPLIMDVNFYDSLSPELQQVIDEAGAAAEAANRARDEELIDVSLESLANDLGIEVIPFDNSNLRERVQSVYGNFPDALPPDLLEQILASDPNS